MRYEYTVTKDDGTAEIMQAMSYKKFKKSLDKNMYYACKL